VRRIERGEMNALEAIDALLAEEITLRENRRVKMALDDKGKRQKLAAGNVYFGTMARQTLADWRSFVPLIEELPNNQAVILGAMRPDLGDTARAVTRGNPQSALPGYAARTKENLFFTEGQPTGARLARLRYGRNAR